MKTNNLKWGVEFKIWHIYPLIWKSRFLLNPFFWSVYLFFSPPHSFMSSIQYQWNTCNSGMRHHWYVSKQWLYKCSDGWKVRAESQYFSPYFKHPHTPIKKKILPPSGFLIIFYNFFFPSIFKISICYLGEWKKHTWYIFRILARQVFFVISEMSGTGKYAFLGDHVVFQLVSF